jgi:hypothetical protein
MLISFIYTFNTIVIPLDYQRTNPEFSIEQGNCANQYLDTGSFTHTPNF